MKTRLLIALPIIALMGAIVIAGFTMAWFSDQKIPSSVSMTMGTVDVDITDPQTNLIPGEEGKFLWNAADGPAQFSWTLQNTGSKRAFLRARLMEHFEFMTTESHSAWGAEADMFEADGRHQFIFPEAQWMTYFKCVVGEEKTTAFVAGNDHEHIGNVDVAVVEENGQDRLQVNITLTEAGWHMIGAHLQVGTQLSSIPRSPGGTPIPGLFTWNADSADTPALPPNATSYTFSIPLPYALGTEVIVAVHASLLEVQAYEEAASPVIWELTAGCPYEWTLGSDGWWYYCPLGGVESDEEVLLCLTGTLMDGVQSGWYTVEAEAEALRATNNAIEYEWPDAPCNP